MPLNPGLSAPPKPAIEKKRHRQKLGRRKENLIKKSYEMSALCNVDVFLGIMNPDNGRVYAFCTDYDGFWAPCTSHLVYYTLCINCLDYELIQEKKLSYPISVLKSPKDFTGVKAGLEGSPVRSPESNSLVIQEQASLQTEEQTC
jgi:hypothetical protein